MSENEAHAPESRTWRAFATDTGEDSSLRYADVQTTRWAADMYACDRGPVVEVTLTEDADGDYLGWINTGEDMPELIQHHRVFPIQFPYGVTAEIEAGAGHPVRLRVVAASN